MTTSFLRSTLPNPNHNTLDPEWWDPTVVKSKPPQIKSTNSKGTRLKMLLKLMDAAKKYALTQNLNSLAGGRKRKSKSKRKLKKKSRKPTRH